MSNSFLNQAYDRSEYLAFLKNKFLTDSFVVLNESLEDDIINHINYFESVKLIGRDESLNLEVIEIQHKSENDPRIGLTKGIHRLMSFYGYQRALVVFKTQESSKWRLSLVTQEYDINQKGKILRKYSNAKRFSFALGQGVQVSTAYEFLVNKGSVTDFATLLGRFSIEVLTNNFYKEIEKEYDKLWNNIKIPSGDVELIKRDFALRLIGRLIFCWFLRAKNWIPDEILSTSAILENADLTDGNFYHGVLEPLFFDTLNKPESERTSSIKDQLTGIPYLNGGLFEPKTDDFYTDQKTQKSEFDSFNLVVPNENIQSIFEVFERYHFTIDESTSTDQEVGIDPEMMGRIFENFIVIRSETGSFYTPRVIVDYMVQSSLVESLKTKFTVLPQTIEQVLEWVGMETRKLQERIIEKPNQKVVLSKVGELNKISISAYLIAKLRGTVFNFRTRKFDDCNAHDEINPEIWQALLDGNFEIQQSFIPNPNNSNVKDLSFVVPKIGYIININSQTFVLFFTVLFNDTLQLDTFYRIYDDKKIAKLCGKNSHKALNTLVNYAQKEQLSESQILKLLEVYVDKKNTSELLELLKIPLMDPSFHILTSLADPGFSVLREIYQLILPNNNNIVKSIFGNDQVIEFITQILDNSYFNKLDQTNQNIITHLSTLRVLDPACGSGAFPMGILQKLTEIIHTLDPNKSIYDIKKNILCNCIYGSDLLPIATEISRLRCWLSLIVDQKEKPVYPEELLPNLEFKFVSANSLVGNKLVDSITAKDTNQPHTDVFGTKIDLQDDLMNGSDETDTILIKLQKIIQDNFNPTKTAKHKIRQNYRELKSQIDISALSQSTDLMAIQEYDHYSNTPSSFFHPKWMFGVDKFDIVIGNPPYVGEKGHREIFDPLKKTVLGERFYQGKMDLFYFFFHLGLDILKPNGILNYITTNYFITATGGANLRKDFEERSNVLELINFGELKIFESALGQHNMITTIQRKSESDNPQLAKTTIVKSKGFLGQKILKDIIDKTDKNTDYYSIPQNQLFKGGNIQLTAGGIDEVLDKIRNNNLKLKQYFNVFKGIETGSVSTYIFNGLPDFYEKLNDNEKPLFKPYYKCSDIQKYSYKNTKKHILYIKSSHDIKLYPNISNYLSKSKNILENRAQIKRSKQNWFGLLWSRDENLFLNHAIVVPYRSEDVSFSLSQGNFYSGTDTYFIVNPNSKMSLKIVLGILNSCLSTKWFKTAGKNKGNILEMTGDNIENIPIPILDTPSKQLLATQIEALVEEILTAKQQPNLDTTELEAQIDALVYELYDLTEEEIAIVAG